MKIIKAEILISRQCNLRCGYCAMWRKERNEISVQAWIEIFETLTKKLSCPFYPIYGAEPLLYPGIYDIIKYFSDNRTAAYSLLTNATQLDSVAKRKLLDAGLDSITLSVDSLSMPGNGSIGKRNDVALKAIQWAIENRIEDVQGTSCVHRQNIEQIPELVRYLSSEGVWYSFDFIHDNKGQDPRLSKVASPNPEYAFSWERDWHTILEFLETMLRMKKEGFMIYQPEAWFEKLLVDPIKFVVDREWKCSDPSWVTIDSDGSVLMCDDYFVPSGIPAVELPDRWDEFVEFKKREVKNCRGCAWCTHWLSDIQLAEADIRAVTHGRRC